VLRKLHECCRYEQMRESFMNALRSNETLRYFPLTSDRFEHQFGIRALPSDEAIVEATERYADEIAIKGQLLAEDADNYVRAVDGSEAAQLEAARLLLLAAPFLSDSGNALTGEKINLENRSLLTIASHLQEDVVLLSGDASQGHPVIAGVVCFPSGWAIGDKLGKSILQVHSPVPEYASLMGQSTDRLLEKLKPDRPVWRMNWGVRASGRLDQSPKQTDRIRGEMTDLTQENAGEQCFFRVERQTLSRLPESGGILFTIHTHQCQISKLADWQKQNLLGVLESCPQATLDYKAISAIKDKVAITLRRDLGATFDDA
jgi:hypothetical protein